MKACFVVSNLSWPPAEGLHEQTLITMRALRSIGASIDVFGIIKDPSALDLDSLDKQWGLSFTEAPTISPGSSLLTGFRLRQPFRRFRSAGETRLVDLVSGGGYDVIHLENVAACGLIRKPHAGRTIVGLVDPGSRRHWRLALKDATGLTRLREVIQSCAHYLFERTLLPRRAIWHVVSNSDAEFLVRWHRSRHPVAIPTAIPSEKLATRISGFDAIEADYIIIWGDIRLPQIQSGVMWLARQVFTPQREPFSYRIVVLGRSLPDDKIQKAFLGLDVEFLERVDNYVELLCRAAVVVLPDRIGTGIKNRAVQCLAMGLVVAGTSVAFEGIDVDSQSALMFDSPAALRAEIDAAMRDPKLRTAIGKQARQMTESKYSELAVATAWRRLYDQVGR